MTDDPVTSLILATGRGDRAAFRGLYQAAGAKLMGVAFRILNDRHEAEDALQEAMTRIWLKAGSFDPSRGSGLGWAVALTRNLCLDRLRAAQGVATFDEGEAESVPDDTPRAETRAIAKGEARRISECFDGLEPDRAAAVRAAYLDGQSYQDLATRFDVPLNTMRTWLRRSLTKLRECMEA